MLREEMALPIAKDTKKKKKVNKLEVDFIGLGMPR